MTQLATKERETYRKGVSADELLSMLQEASIIYFRTYSPDAPFGGHSIEVTADAVRSLIRVSRQNGGTPTFNTSFYADILFIN